MFLGCCWICIQRKIQQRWWSAPSHFSPNASTCYHTKVVVVTVGFNLSVVFSGEICCCLLKKDHNAKTTSYLITGSDKQVQILITEMRNVAAQWLPSGLSLEIANLQKSETTPHVVIWSNRLDPSIRLSPSSARATLKSFPPLIGSRAHFVVLKTPRTSDPIQPC